MPLSKKFVMVWVHEWFVHEDVFETDISRLVMRQYCLFSPSPLQKLEIVWSVLYKDKKFILRLV